jgi:hypothetical protein
MKQPNKEEIMKKWAPILGSMGMTGSQLDNLSQLAENQSNQILEETKTEEFPSLFPMAMKIAAQTIGQDLVSVQPMAGPGGMSKEERERIEAEIKQKNRDGKIDSLIEGTEYKEEKVEQPPDYKPGSGGQLFYIWDMPGALTTFQQSFSFNIKLTAGQTIKIQCYQDSGGNEELGNSGLSYTADYLTITKVS